MSLMEFNKFSLEGRLNLSNPNQEQLQYHHGLTEKLLITNFTGIYIKYHNPMSGQYIPVVNSTDGSHGNVVLNRI